MLVTPDVSKRLSWKENLLKVTPCRLQKVTAKQKLLDPLAEADYKASSPSHSGEERKSKKLRIPSIAASINEPVPSFSCKISDKRKKGSKGCKSVSPPTYDEVHEALSIFDAGPTSAQEHNMDLEISLREDIF